MKLVFATLALATLASLASCAPKAIVVAPIAPRAIAVQERARHVVVASEKVREGVVVAQKTATGLAAEAAGMKAEADRLSRLPALTPADWDVFRTLAETHSRNAWAHEIQMRGIAEKATEIVVEQKALQVAATDLAAHAVTTDQQTSDLVVKNESLKEGAGKWKAMWRIIIFGAVILVLLIGVYAYLRLMNPLA